MILNPCSIIFADSLTPLADVPSHGGWHRAAVLFGYGLFLIIGGIIGYVKAKSAPSLIAGGVSGIIAILLGVFATWAYTPLAALILSLVLAVIMGQRYLKTKKAMPALLIVIVSLVVAALETYVLLRHH